MAETPHVLILHGNDEFAIAAHIAKLCAGLGDPSTADMNMVLGDAMRGRQLPHVEPHAASMGCPQLGHGCSSVRAGGAIDARKSSGGEPSTLLHEGLRRGAGPRLPGLRLEGMPFFDLSNTGSSPLGMIGLQATMVKHLSQRIRLPEVSLDSA